MTARAFRVKNNFFGVKLFDSILFCCLKILGYKAHPEITTELEPSSKL